MGRENEEEMAEEFIGDGEDGRKMRDVDRPSGMEGAGCT